MSGRLRSRSSRLGDLAEDQEPAAPEPSIAPPPNRRLRRAIGRLSPRLRSVVVRLYYQELTALEVAAQDGTDTASVERTRRRALARMRRDLRGPRP